MTASILIADDNTDTRELLRLMLESGGYVVREVLNGRECVIAALSQPPDLALIDLSMPVLDGWETLHELRTDESTRAIPCVAVTAFAADSDRQRALEAGFNAYLSKPFYAKELLEMVKRLLAERAKSQIMT